MSNRRGEINLLYDESLPDSIITACEVAKSIWESKISTRQPIYIEVLMDELDSDIVMLTEVGYFDETSPVLSSGATPKYGSTDGFIETTGLQSGIYIVSITDCNTQETSHLKFVK